MRRKMANEGKKNGLGRRAQVAADDLTDELDERLKRWPWR